jgi:RNA polymerase sigma factor (sigma-70 family)
VVRLFPARRPACLLAQAREDPDAFAAFYDAYAERVLVFLTRRVLDVDTAFDLLSETFATALEQRRKFRGATAQEEQGWLFAIARSELSRYWRHGRVERSALARLGVGVPGLSDPEIERIEELAGIAGLAAQLGEAMRALPEDQRRAVELRVVCECPYDDVAGRLGVSEQTARARVSRGLRALSHQLEDASLATGCEGPGAGFSHLGVPR